MPGAVDTVVVPRTWVSAGMPALIFLVHLLTGMRITYFAGLFTGAVARGDNGAGLRVSHEAGRMGVIARLMHLFAALRPECLKAGKKAVFERPAEPIGSLTDAVA
jgi:hypothetical protein